MGGFAKPDFYKNILGNTVVVFVIIVILLLIVTYLVFKKVETYKYVIIINIISSIIIFVLLSLNDHYKNVNNNTKYDIVGGHKADETKLKYFSNILNDGNSNSESDSPVTDNVDLEIESLIKELKV